MDMLTDIGTIFYHIISPLFVIIIAGAWLERKFVFEIRTLSKICFYLLLPAMLFTVFIQSSINWNNLLLFSIVQLCQLGSVSVFSWWAAGLLRMPTKKKGAFILGSAFPNSGNFGIPLIAMIFTVNTMEVLSYHSFTVLIQNFLIFTFGVAIVGHGRPSMKNSLGKMFRLPLVYAMLFAVLIRALSIPIQEIPVIWGPLGIASDGLISIAMLTIGIQLAKLRKVQLSRVLISATVIKLIISPLFALIFVFVFNLQGFLAQLVVITAATPTAVNTALIGIEYDNEPELSSSIVGLTTIISAVSVSLIVYFVMSYIH